MLDYLIIGGGMSGVALARLLQLKKKGRFLVVEAHDEAGGLCRTQKVGRHDLDIGGGHFLCSAHQEVYDFIFAHLGQDQFNRFDRVSKIDVRGHDIDYPLESNLWQLPLPLRQEYLRSIRAAVRAKHSRPPRNYAEWIRRNLGPSIARDYMLPYNAKIWGIAPGKMGTFWLHKIPRLNLEAITRALAERRTPHAAFPSHVQFYYPKHGGFQAIFDAIYAQVKNETITGQPVRKIRREKGCWVVNGDLKAKTVINTAPWPALFDALGRPPKLAGHFKKLVSNSIVVSLWEKPYEHDWHWSYHPSLAQEYHRLFYIHNFSPRSPQNGIYTETNFNRWPGRGGDWAWGGHPLFEHINPVAYPVPVLGSQAAIQAILAHYRRQQLLGLGRWGQWQYLNADVCIREAMRLAEAL